MLVIHIIYEKICYDTFISSVSQIKSLVKKTIYVAFPGRICILCDELIRNDTHYTGIFTAHPSFKPHEYDTVLMVLSPFVTEESEKVVED